MAEFRIRLQLAALPTVQAVIYQRVFPLLTQAVGAVAQQTAINWSAAVHAAKLWSGEKDAYMASIQTKMTGAFSALVWSDYKMAEQIEQGRPARDLKKMLDTSLKVRSGKNGRYPIIPFRHNTPGQNAVGPSMPDHVYAAAKKLKPSSVLGMTQRESGTGAWDVKTRAPLMVPQRVYQWGGKLPPGSMGPNARNKADRFAGMVRFADPAKNGPRYSTYLTFRVMTEKSKGWIIPPQPGLHLARQVAAEMQPVAEEIFADAVKRSL